MMLCKLIFRNIRRSFQDYIVYFLTLILGVAIFYAFNSIDAQTAMLELSADSHDIIKLLVGMLSYVSGIVACILGFLIIYANRFLIRRRNQEFAIYMTLGMGKGQISRLLLGETFMIGVLSLVVGLIAGVFASQFMSILTAKMFEADMTAYTFIYSRDAAVKTVVYFSIIYLIVMVFSVFSVSRCKLIDLLQASRRGEHRRIRSSLLSVLVFLIAAVILGFCYYQVSVRSTMLDKNQTLIIILLGCVCTFLVFWSASGFFLNLARRFQSFYLKSLNAFVLRQVDGQFHTSVFSMSIICLLFFVTITVLSAGLALNNALRENLQSLAPKDLCLYKTMDLPAEGYSEEQISESRLGITDILEKYGFDLSLLAPGYVEVTVYTSPEITWESTLGSMREEVTALFPYLLWDTAEEIVGLSDYNRMAAFYGQPAYELEDDEYLIVCTFESMKQIRNMVLADFPALTIGGDVLSLRENTCKEGYLIMNAMDVNTGFILVPDRIIADAAAYGLTREENILTADYNAGTKEELQRIDDLIAGLPVPWDSMLEGASKISIYNSAVGLSSIIVFLAIYLGIIFLIAGAALISLKQLSDSADGRDRFRILNQIGVEKKMQHRALLGQMSIYFCLPMLLAILHSIFGIQYARNIMSLYSGKDMLVSILFTALTLVLIYGAYFAATYQNAKRMLSQ